MTLASGIAYDAMLYGKSGAAQEDLRQTIMGVAVSPQTTQGDVTPVGSERMEYVLHPLDERLTLRVRATDEASKTGEYGDVVNIAWIRRGIARAYSGMIVSRVSEPDDFARTPVFTVELIPGPGAVSSRGTALDNADGDTITDYAADVAEADTPVVAE